MPYSSDRPARRRLLSRVTVGLSVAATFLASLAPFIAGTAQAVDQTAPPPPTVQTPTATTAASATAQPIVRYRVANTDGEGLRIRSSAGLDARIVAQLPEGALVTLRDAAPVDDDGERWVPVRSQEGQGWVASRYLVKAADTSVVAPSFATDSSFVERVVTIARSANGQPYAWAGTKPGGFDCSGFVQWVYTRAGVKAMPRMIVDQMQVGAVVDRSKIQPGDLLVFVNTYTVGISHAGVALGNNLFQHASDEVHGVTVSNLTEPYWQDRLYRAVRLVK